MVVGGGRLGGLKNKSVFLSQGPGSSRGFRRKCVDGEKEQNREKNNPMSGRNVSDSPDKTSALHLLTSLLPLLLFFVFCFFSCLSFSKGVFFDLVEQK